MKTFIAHALTLGSASAYFTLMGSCPDEIPAVEDFDGARYMGRWYEIQRDSWNWFELGAECVTATYTMKIDGQIEVFNRQRTALGWYDAILGNAVCDREDGEGRCNVGFGPTQATSTTKAWTDSERSGSSAYWWDDMKRAMQ